MTLDLVGSAETTEFLPTANDSGAKIAVLADGGHVMVWEEAHDGGLNTVKWQRFDASGAPVGEAAVIGDPSFTSMPQITTLADGGFAVAYVIGGNSAIEVQRFDAWSQPVGDPIRADVPGDYGAVPSLAGTPDGGVVVTWAGVGLEEGRPWDWGIGLQRFDASGQAVGTVMQVNTETYGQQFMPKVTVLSDGGYVVIWQTQSESDWSYGAAMRRFDAQGNPVGDEVAVSPSAHQEFPSSVTALADGGWVVSWASDKDDVQDVYAQVYNADGTLRGSEIHLANTGFQWGGSVTALADGGFMLAWESNDGSAMGGEILAQRFDASGSAVGDAFAVNVTTAGDQGMVTIAGRPDGGFVAAWQTNGVWNADPANPDTWNGGTVSQRVFVPDGLGGTVGGAEFTEAKPPVNDSLPKVAVLAGGSEIVVWQEAVDDGYVTKVQRIEPWGSGSVQVLGSADATYSPQITALAGGGYALAYLTGSGIQVQAFDAWSTPVGEPVQASQGGSWQTLAGTPDGGFLLAWSGTGLEDDPSSWGIALQRFDATGSAVGEVARVNTETYGDQSQAAIAVLADGGFVVTWQTQNATDYSYDVAMRRFDASGQPVGDEVAVSPGASQEFSPKVAALADGGWVVTWASNKDDAQDVYAQIYNGDGSARGGEMHLAAEGYQGSPSVAALGDGGFAIAWVGSSDSTTGQDVVAQRFDALGNGIGGAFTLSQTVAGDQDQVALATRADGGLAAVWQTNGDWAASDPTQPWNTTQSGGTVSIRDFALVDNGSETLIQAMSSFAPASGNGLVLATDPVPPADNQLAASTH